MCELDQEVMTPTPMVALDAGGLNPVTVTINRDIALDCLALPL